MDILNFQGSLRFHLEQEEGKNKLRGPLFLML